METMQRKHGYGNILMTVSGILLCLTLITSYMTAGMYARFVSSDTGSDSARVAAFRVTESGEVSQSFSAALAPGRPHMTQIVVDNASEVAVTYTISIKNESRNLPVVFILSDAAHGTADEFIANGTPLNAESNYSYVGYIQPSTVCTYYLMIHWPPTTEENDIQYIGMVDRINVTLTATQTD